MTELPLWTLAPLLHAASTPQSRLVVGGVDLGHWMELNPVVIDCNLESEPEEMGFPRWPSQRRVPPVGMGQHHVRHGPSKGTKEP